MKTTKKAVWATFALLLSISWILIHITGYRVLTLDFFIKSGELLTGDPATEELAYHQLQKWIYFSQAGYLSIKILLVSVTIYTALYLAGQKCSFSEVVMIAIRCEFIFLLAAVVKILAFPYLYDQATLADWHKFHPLSMLSIVGNVGASWYYMLQLLNAFELLYCFTLAYCIYRLTHISYDHSVRIVFCSYVPALILWALAISFVSVVIFPSHM